MTREAILKSCLKLFAKHGFTSTSIDMIANASGITKGAVYWHFESKDALFDAILQSIRVRWQQAVVTRVTTESPAPARLGQLFVGYSDLFTKDPEICLFMQRILLEGDEKYSPHIGRVFRVTARFIAGVLDEGKKQGQFRTDFDSLVAAHSILGTIAGATQQHLVNPALKLDRLLDDARQMALAHVGVDTE